MATKLPDFRNRLPSVSELLDTPPVRAVADRWNRSRVASGVRSFLGELRRDLERRTAHANLPSVREIAERAARHVALLQFASVRPTINATGCLLAPQWLGRPLSDAALEQVVAHAGGFVGQLGDDRSQTTSICRATGAEAALVVHSYAQAVWLTFAALAAGKPCLVSRAEAGDVEPGCSLAALAAAAGATLHEIGTANRTTAAHYEAAVGESSALLLKHSPDGYAIAGEQECPEWDELVALAGEHQLPLIHAAGSAPLVDGLPAIAGVGRSIASDVATGVSLVIARGDGLIGGPPCGLLIGTHDIVEQIASHPMFAASRVDPLRAIALRTTVEAYDDRRQLELSVPLFQLLATPIDNLRQRAERLAPQLAAADAIESAQPVQTENCLGIARYADWPVPSHGIALTAADGQLDALDQKMRSAPVAIVGRREADRLVLDLRSVLPRDDHRLAQMLVEELSGSAPPPPDDAP